LHVGGPDVDSSSPQISMVMSPTGGLEGDYFVFALNHGNVPGFTAGGMQVQHWYDEEAVDTSNGPQLETLSHNDETISWTQKLSVNNGTVAFEILDGSSQTWNAFGGQGYLKASVSTAMETLNSYRPAVSITESGIGYAGNRVSSLVLTKLRWTTSDGETHEMIAPIDIDADLDP
jgi:hypothetical protein